MTYLEEKYQKIWGLKKLEELNLPVPKYRIVEFYKADRAEIENRVNEQISKFELPDKKGLAVGVTLRVSLPGKLDKSGKHGSLHIMTKQKLVEEILEKYDEYGIRCKIIVQDTIDANSSGTLLIERNHCIIETVPGDAPALLEGKTNNYESWRYSLKTNLWKREWHFTANGNICSILTFSDLKRFERFLIRIPNNSYLEWSISKSNDIFFYEFMKLSDFSK